MNKQINSFSEGVLPDFLINDLVEQSVINFSNIGNTQPGSIDITPDLDNIFEIENFLPPRSNEKVADLVNYLGGKKTRDSKLLKDKKYLIKVKESIKNLPYMSRMSPKSSIGRVFLHTRLLVDKNMSFDHIPKNYSGDLWFLVSPKFFDIKLAEGEPLAQLRFFKGDARLLRKDLVREIVFKNFLKYEQVPLFNDIDNILEISEKGTHSLSVDFSSEIIAYETAIQYSGRYIDLSKRNFYPTEDFFKPITQLDLNNNSLVLEKGRGYLLSSREIIHTPKEMSAEVLTFTEKYGEARSHFAGFIDPGFKGTITFEVAAYEAGLAIRNGQAIADIQYEYMLDVPTHVYSGNYQNQKIGPALPKYFKK